MARIKFGSVVTEGSGKLGGHVFQNSSGGAQLRIKPLPGQKCSPSQSLIRSLNHQLQKGWRDLTDAQRKIWNDWPVIHSVMTVRDPHRPLSGHDLWMKYNFSWLYAGGSFLPDPSYWGGPVLGPELITNGTFQGSPPWLFYGGWNYVPFKANFNDTSNGRVQQKVTIANATNYRIVFDILDSPGAGYIWFTNELNAAFLPAPYNTYKNFINGHYDLSLVTIATATQLRVFASVAGSSFSIDNISFRKIF